MPRGIHEETGFSLVELIIAMFVLAVVSLAVLPLLVGTARARVENRGLLTATAFANDRLAELQADYPATPGDDSTSCAALRALQANPPAVDPATGLVARLSVGTCPATFPASVPVTVTVSEGGEDVTAVTTRLRVGAA
jgi:prepilin-type N-terminal cleavage/methylation domain-containing protein